MIQRCLEAIIVVLLFLALLLHMLQHSLSRRERQQDSVAQREQRCRPPEHPFSS